MTLMSRELGEEEKEGFIQQLREGDERVVSSSFERIMEKEKIEGKAEGKAEAVLVLLGRKGEVPSDVECAIRAQTDTEVLTEWLLLAANVKTVGEFQEQMGSIPGKRL